MNTTTTTKLTMQQLSIENMVEAILIKDKARNLFNTPDSPFAIVKTLDSGVIIEEHYSSKGIRVKASFPEEQSDNSIGEFLREILKECNMNGYKIAKLSININVYVDLVPIQSEHLIELAVSQLNYID